MPATTVPTRAQRPLDTTDRVLLEALLRDGRASHRELSTRTGLSLATVNRRVRSLEADKIIKGYTAILEPEAVGWAFTAIVGLRIDKGHLREVQEQISRDPRVVSVYDVTGDWDGIVIARLTDRADLDDLAKTTLSVDHIQRTTTLMVLKTVTEDALVRLP